MNEKQKELLRAARSASSSIQPSAQTESRVPASSKRAPSDSARGFYNRQARTDAALRTIPGLHEFGK
jgi:hypothetical protein